MIKPLRFLLILAIFFPSSSFSQERLIDANNGNQVSTLDPSYQGNAYNYTTFSPDNEKNISAELLRETPKEFQAHPEFGISPHDAGCVDCFELLEKRTADTRYFLKNNSAGKVVYTQKFSVPVHFPDAQGYLVSSNHHLAPVAGQNGVYSSKKQLYPATIDLHGKYSSLKNNDKEFAFNRNLQLMHKDVSGTVTSLGNANWNDATAGDDGVYIRNIWPGIDLEIRVYPDKLKTNFIVKQALNLSDGFLIIQDEMDLPAGSTFDLSEAATTPSGNVLGDIPVRGSDNQELFAVIEGMIHDASKEITDLEYKVLHGNKFQLHTPLDWLNDPSRNYPVTIDPLVTTSGTNAAIFFNSGYNATCHAGFCSHFLVVNTPAKTTVTDIIHADEHEALGACWTMDGGVSFLLNGGCKHPPGATTAFSCGGTLPGTCGTTGLSGFADMNGCLPPPSCGGTPLTFTYNIHRCWSAGGCSSTCVRGNLPWSFTIEGQTVQQPVLTSSKGLTICLGDITDLGAVGVWGVPPYTYAWSDGGTGPVNTVGPLVTTNYTVTTTDACGEIATNNITITVTAPGVPVPIIGYTMSPAGGNPCPVTVTFFTNVGSAYAGGPENFEWAFPGGTVTGGGALSGSANGPEYGGAGGAFTVVYNNSGSYTAGVALDKLGTCWANNVNFDICTIPLDAELLEFSVRGNTTKVLINWKTEKETNTEKFIIERSSDGISFEAMGAHDAAGTSTDERSYAMEDQDPYIGKSYYRLKTMDKNGSHSYSKVETVVIGNFEQSMLRITPNPVLRKANIYLETAPESDGSVSVINLKGQVVYEGPVEFDGSEKVFFIDTSEFSSGIYYVKLGIGRTVYSGKFSKN